MPLLPLRTDVVAVEHMHRRGVVNGPRFLVPVQNTSSLHMLTEQLICIENFAPSIKRPWSNGLLVSVFRKTTITLAIFLENCQLTRSASERVIDDGIEPKNSELRTAQM